MRYGGGRVGGVRVSQYVTGRGESYGYNFSLASDSGFAVADWMRDSTRASKIRNTGVVELQTSPNDNGLQPSDFVLCYSEHVWHKIIEENGQMVAVPTREYDYSHYLVVSADYQQQEGIAPDDTITMAAKLLCAGKFLDLYQYQQVSSENQNIPFTTFDIADEELNQAYEAYRERSALPVVFTGPKLAAFLARYWEHCWARFANDPDARPMFLVVTSPERNDPEREEYDITNVLVDGIVFFSQYVLPNLPSAARQIASVSFGSVVEQPNAQRGTACMVCYPTNSALNANPVYCSFENEIVERNIDEYDIRLGTAMMNHAMPESYTRLCTLAKSEILAKNYDLVRLMVMYEAMLENFADSDLQKSIVIGYRGLGQMQEILRNGDVKNMAARTFVLYPLEYGYVSACVQNAVPYDEGVYENWLASAQTLRDRSAMLQSDELERLETLYTALLQKTFPALTLNRNPLDVLLTHDEEPLTDIEGGLLLNNMLGWQGGVPDPEKQGRLIERLVYLRAIQRDGTADAYSNTIINACAADVATVLHLYLLTVRQTRLPGGDHAKVIEDLKRMITLLLADSAMNTGIATDLLEWYQSLGSGDQKLAEPFVANAVQAAVAEGITTGKPQELIQLVRFYYQLPHTDDTVARAILDRAYKDGYHKLLADTDLQLLLKVFFEAPCNRQYAVEFGDKLLAMAREEPASLCDFNALRKLPCDGKAAHALVQDLLERTLQEQLPPKMLEELTLTYQNEGDNARAVAPYLLQRCRSALPEAVSASLDDTMEARIRQLLAFVKAVKLPHLMDTYIALCFADVLPPVLLSEAFVKELQAQRDKSDTQGAEQLKKALEDWSRRVLLKEQEEKPQDLPSLQFLERLCAVVGVAGMSKAELKPAVRDYCAAILERVYKANPKQLPSAVFLDKLCQAVNAFDVAKQDLRPVLQRWCTGAIQAAQADNRLSLPSNNLLQSLKSAMDACGMQVVDLRKPIEEWYRSAAAAIQEQAPGALPEISFVTDALALATVFDIKLETVQEPLRAWYSRALQEVHKKTPMALPDEALLAHLSETMTICRIPTSDLEIAMEAWYLETAAAIQQKTPSALPTLAFVTDALALADTFSVPQSKIRESLQAWCIRAMKEVQVQNPTALPDPVLIQRLNEVMEACGLKASDLREAMREWYLGVVAAIQEAVPTALPGTMLTQDALRLGGAFAIDLEDIRDPLQAWCERVVNQTMQRSDALPEGGFLSALNEVLDEGGLKRGPIKPIMFTWYERQGTGLGAHIVRTQMRQTAKEYDIRPDEDTTIASEQWSRFFLAEEYDALCGAVENRSSADQLWRLQDDEQTRLFELHYRRHQISISQLDEKLTKCLAKDRQLLQAAYLMRMMDRAEALGGGCYPERVQHAFHQYLTANIRELFGPSITLTFGHAPQGHSMMAEDNEQTRETKEKAAMLRRWNRWRQAHWQGVQNAELVALITAACAECDLYERLAQTTSAEARKRLLADYLESYTNYKRTPESDALLLSYGMMQLSALPILEQSVSYLLMCVADGGKNLSIDWDRYLDGAFPQKVPWVKIDLWKDDGNAYPVMAALLSWMQGPLETLGATFRSYVDHAAFGRRAKRKAALRKHLRYVPEQSAGEFATNPMLEWLKDWNPIPKGESL